MQDPIYAQITDNGRPSLVAASGSMALAAVGLWVSGLIEIGLGVTSTALLNALYYLPFIALPLVLYARRRPGAAGSMRLNPLPLLSIPTLIILALVSVYVASGMSEVWGMGLEALGLRSVGGTPVPDSEQALLLAILVDAALPALCEELLFRGFALAAWESRGTAFAIGVTSALFALLHGNVFGLPAYLLVGAVAGYATFALDSVYAGIVYHTLYNTACLAIPYLLRGQVEAMEDAAANISALALALDLVLYAVMLAALLWTLRLRAQRHNLTSIPRIRRPLNTTERLMLAVAVGMMLTTMVVVVIISL